MGRGSIKPTRFAFIQLYIASVFAVAVSVAVFFYGLPNLSAVLIIASVVPALVAEAIVRGTEYRVEDDGIRSIFKLIIEKESFIPYGRIQDIKIEKGLVGVIFNFGDILIDTAGTPGYEGMLRGVSEPEELYDEIVERMNEIKSGDGV